VLWLPGLSGWSAYIFAQDDLTSNPLTGVTLSAGVIKIVANATGGGDDCPLPFTPTAAVRSWATHSQNSTFAITETASQDATFSAGKLTPYGA
jgi:hypothetical protein